MNIDKFKAYQFAKQVGVDIETIDAYIKYIENNDVGIDVIASILEIRDVYRNNGHELDLSNDAYQVFLDLEFDHFIKLDDSDESEVEEINEFKEKALHFANQMQVEEDEVLDYIDYLKNAGVLEDEDDVYKAILEIRDVYRNGGDRDDLYDAYDVYVNLNFNPNMFDKKPKKDLFEPKGSEFDVENPATEKTLDAIIAGKETQSKPNPLKIWIKDVFEKMQNPGDEEDRDDVVVQENEFDSADEFYQDLVDIESENNEVSYYLYEDLRLDNKQITNFVGAFLGKFPEATRNHDIFEKAVLEIKDLKPFTAGGNLWSTGQSISNEGLFAMRWLAGLKFEEVLDILKFDRNDSNLAQDLRFGNIGTAQRWTKTVTGSNLEDDTEMQCGRYAKPPRLATFPNTHVDGKSLGIPIVKKIDVNSLCSHHFLPYGTLLEEDAFAFVAYIPKDYVLGISKLQRVADWVCRRPTIQEDLVKTLWEEISKAAQTEDVWIFVGNSRHTCEYLRGSQSHDGLFTTEMYKGKFQDPQLRQNIISSVK